jgi:FixJ family two-component response regulator
VTSAPPFIAIVDDEESVRKAIERLLRSVGLHARIFASGGEFLAAADECPPSCVVLDLHMPGMSGFGVMESLRGRFPVVVITGNDSPEARSQSLRSGAVAYLRKPVGDKELLEAISIAIADSGVNDSAPR